MNFTQRTYKYSPIVIWPPWLVENSGASRSNPNGTQFWPLAPKDLPTPDSILGSCRTFRLAACWNKFCISMCRNFVSSAIPNIGVIRKVSNLLNVKLLCLWLNRYDKQAKSSHEFGLIWAYREIRSLSYVKIFLMLTSSLQNFWSCMYILDTKSSLVYPKPNTLQSPDNILDCTFNNHFKIVY
jgi:hypothetical protein